MTPTTMHPRPTTRQATPPGYAPDVYRAAMAAGDKAQAIEYSRRLRGPHRGPANVKPAHWARYMATLAGTREFKAELARLREVVAA